MRNVQRKSPLKRVKTEREFVVALARTGASVMLAAILIAVSFTWFTTRDFAPQIHHQALWTATLLPLVIVPACIAIIGRQNLYDHRLMLDILELAHTDEMTQLPNRRGFMRDAAKVLAGNVQAGLGTCIFLIDIDHFKQVNDKFGHPAGDCTLIEIATAMRKVLPANVALARLGGEEFSALLTFGSFSEIHEHAEALRDAVARTVCEVDGAQIQVTVSVGIGIAGPGDTVSLVLCKADGALYAAKGEGRNRFSIAA